MNANGTTSTPVTNWRMVRPREMRARNRPTNGAQAIHQAQKNRVQLFSQSSGRSKAKVSSAIDGKRESVSPMLVIIPSKRNEVLPATSTNTISAMHSSTFSSESRRMPFSTPVSTEIVAISTAMTIRMICHMVFSGMSNMKFSPKFSWATPMPSEVAMPKIVPSIAAMSTACPIQPWIRSPSSG